MESRSSGRRIEILLPCLREADVLRNRGRGEAVERDERNPGLELSGRDQFDADGRCEQNTDTEANRRDHVSPLKVRIPPEHPNPLGIETFGWEPNLRVLRNALGRAMMARVVGSP